MNERIRELAVQAKLVAEEDINRQISYNDELKAFAEKFAELLIRDCIQVIGPEDSYIDEWFKAKADSVVRIKEHFGVE